jgi:flagellar biosynthesis/type III secretory pathway protein FliH
MNNFCVDTIAGNPHLRAHHGILRAAGLPLTADARRAARLLVRDAQSKADALVENAHGMADDILANARAKAEQILADAGEQAQRLTADEQQRVIEQSSALLQSIQQTHDAVLERVEDMVIDLAQTLYNRVVMEATPRERIDAALRRVIQEAPPKLVDTLLRVHPDDVALLPEVDWPIKADVSLVPGACRLEASNGQWCANFDAAVQAVKAAFAQGIEDAQSDTPAAEDAGDGGPAG